MINPFEKENLSNWVSEYSESDTAKKHPPEIQSGGSFFLQELLLKTIEKSGGVDSIEEKDLGEELKSLSNRYDLTETMKNNLPAYIGDFFEDLETQGRFSNGRVFGKFIRTFKGRLGHQTVRRPGSKISRNDPCPCGSGLKFKKCCQGKLD